MAAEHVVGITAEVLVIVASVDQAAQTCNVRVVDDNMQPITPAPGLTLPMSLVDVVGFPIGIGDVIERIEDGITAVVRFVSPTDPSKWSPAAAGSPLNTSLGWKKIGTAVIP